MIIDRENKLDFFKELYSSACKSAEADIKLLEVNRKQYYETLEFKEGKKKKLLPNLTYELIESQVSTNIPKVQVIPEIQSDMNERNAQAIETLFNNVAEKQRLRSLDDLDERRTYYHGAVAYVVDWDSTIKTHNTRGDVTIESYTVDRVVGQPGVYEIDKMDYVFLYYESTVDEIERRYDVKIEEQEETTVVEIVTCWYKDEEGRICRYTMCGDYELEDIEDYYSRQRYVCKKCGKSQVSCRCEEPNFERDTDEYEDIVTPITRSDGTKILPISPKYEDGILVTETKKQVAKTETGEIAQADIDGIKIPALADVEVPVLEPTRIPYYVPKHFPIVIRKNISKDNSLFGQSDSEVIKTEHDAFNEIWTRILQKTLKSGIMLKKPKGSKNKISSGIYEDEIEIDASNQTLWGTLDMQPNIKQDLAVAEEIYQRAKAILGITNSFQGQQDTTATSGYAKQIQVQQAQGRLESKRLMKAEAFAQIAQRVFELYLAYADEPRIIAYKDNRGKLQNLSFNRYDFYAQDFNGEWYIDDAFIFSMDKSGDIASNKMFLWRENKENLSAGAFGPPQSLSALIIYWENMEKCHYPNASDNVARLREQQRQEQEQMMQMQQRQFMQSPQVPPTNIMQQQSPIEAPIPQDI